jgi:hypothetical protein
MRCLWSVTKKIWPFFLENLRILRSEFLMLFLCRRVSGFHGFYGFWNHVKKHVQIAERLLWNIFPTNWLYSVPWWTPSLDHVNHILLILGKLGPSTFLAHLLSFEIFPWHCFFQFSWFFHCDLKKHPYLHEYSLNWLPTLMQLYKNNILAQWMRVYRLDEDQVEKLCQEMFEESRL